MNLTAKKYNAFEREAMEVTKTKVERPLNQCLDSPLSINKMFKIMVADGESTYENHFSWSASKPKQHGIQY
jgi:hypothetical protein